MGRPKITVIDDSKPEVEVKKQKSKIKTEEKSPSVIPSEPVLSEAEVVEGSQDLKNTESGNSSLIAQNDKENKPKKAQKPGKQKKVRSKKYQELVAKLDRSKTYSLNEAVEEVKKLSYSKFVGAMEIHINTNQAGLRGLVSLPFSVGKKLRILAFGPAQQSFAGLEGVIIGDEAKVEEIGKGLPALTAVRQAGRQGKINFDLVVTTPEWMPKLAKIAKNLGPRGLMPSPKNGTITDDLKKTIEGFQAGKTEYKTEAKGKVIHLALGKLNQPTEELSANIKTLLQTLGKTKVSKATLSPTMGPSVKVDLSSF